MDLGKSMGDECVLEIRRLVDPRDGWHMDNVITMVSRVKGEVVAIIGDELALDLGSWMRP